MHMDNKWVYKLTINLSGEEHQDIVLAFISSMDINALEQTDDTLEIYHEERLILETLQDLLEPLTFLSREQMVLEDIENKNWNEEWEKSFAPIVVGDFCTIRASFHDIDTKGYDIIINPELAFGTGHHETTYMMIEQMSRLDFTDKSVFDYGCGTAILAILAKMMGAGRSLAIDYDEQSIKCATDCLALNDTIGIDLKTATIDQVTDAPFDIVLANINRNVLLETVTDVYRLTASGGSLVLSGLLRADEAMITELYTTAGFIKKNVCIRNEWISMLMHKP